MSYQEPVRDRLALCPMVRSTQARPVGREPAAALLLRLQQGAGNRAVAASLQESSTRSLSDRANGRGTALQRRRRVPAAGTIQRVVYPNMAAMWAAVHPAFNQAHINADPVLNAIYQDAANQLPIVDFLHVAGAQPDITAQPSPPNPTPFVLRWDTAANLGWDNDHFTGAVIHELAHAAAAQMYQHHGALQGTYQFTNMHLPVAAGAVNPATGMTPNQSASLQQQELTTTANWTDLDAELTADHNAGLISDTDHQHLQTRIGYAVFNNPHAHNEAVLADILYYMQAKGLTGLETYAYARRMLDEANQRRQAPAAGGAAGRVNPRPWYLTMWPRLPIMC